MNKVVRFLNTPWMKPNPNQGSMMGMVLLGILISIPIGIILTFGIYPAGAIVIPLTIVALLIWYKSGLADVL